MANTQSLGFPNMFDVSRNRVAVYEDIKSVVNRTRLLLLTEPTEMYNSPEIGVGLRRFLWTYNTENQKSIIQDAIVKQISQYEPCVDSSNISFSDGRAFTDGNVDATQQYNKLEMTIGLPTTFGSVANLNTKDFSGGK